MQSLNESDDSCVQNETDYVTVKPSTSTGDESNGSYSQKGKIDSNMYLWKEVRHFTISDSLTEEMMIDEQQSTCKIYELIFQKLNYHSSMLHSINETLSTIENTQANLDGKLTKIQN